MIEFRTMRTGVCDEMQRELIAAELRGTVIWLGND
jgi:hypothetical protein